MLMNNTTIDITPSIRSLKPRKGLKIERTQPESLMEEIQYTNTRIIPFDYEEIRHRIRDRVVQIQDDGLSNYDYHMSSQDTLPEYLRSQRRWLIVYCPLCYCFSMMLIYYLVRRIMLPDEYDKLFTPLLKFLIFAIFVLPVALWVAFSLSRPIYLSCRTFKEIEHTVSVEQMDTLFDKALCYAMRTSINEVAMSVVCESRVCVYCVVSPLHLVMGKPDTACIIKIEPYKESYYEDDDDDA